MDRPGRKRLPGARPADAISIIDAKQRAVPFAPDISAAGSEIVVKLAGKRNSGMGTAIDIADNPLPLPDDEAVETARAHLENEVPRLAVGYIAKRAEPDIGRRFVSARAAAGHHASASG